MSDNVLRSRLDHFKTDVLPTVPVPFHFTGGVAQWPTKLIRGYFDEFKKFRHKSNSVLGSNRNIFKRPIRLSVIASRFPLQQLLPLPADDSTGRTGMNLGVLASVESRCCFLEAKNKFMEHARRFSREDPPALSE